MEKITHSPLPTKKVVEVKTMNFSEAVCQIVNGKKVTRQEWGNSAIYGFLYKEVLSLFKDGIEHQWIISEGDMVGKDWVIIE